MSSSENKDPAVESGRSRKALNTVSVGLCASATCVWLGCGAAQAGGLYLNEFATPSMGTAGAGATAWANDAATAWHNAAGMTRIEGNELSVGAGLGSVDVEFDPDPATPFGGGDGGDAGGLVPLLGTFGVYSASDDLKFGVGVFSVSGAVLDYTDSWSGRFQAQEVELLTVSVVPTVAYRVTDWMSVSAGPVFTYGSLDFDLAVPPGGAGQANLDGDDIAYGFTLGSLFELSPQTRVGVVYLSEQTLEFDGDLTVQPAGLNIGSETELKLAQMVRVGLYHDIDEQWALLASVGWEDWSTFSDLLVSTDGGSAKIPRNWDDTYHLSIGAHYRYTEDWLFQAGITYDSSPVNSGDRTADMPIDEQWRFGVGAQHQLSETMSVGGSFVYADFGDAPIDDPATLVGDYDRNRAFFFSLNANWKF